MSVRRVFELPLPENPNGSALRGAHWSKIRKAKHAYWNHLDVLVMARRLPGPPERPMAALIGTADVRTWRQMDQDNGNARMKFVWDWLQKRGYIVNDRAVRCQLNPRSVPRKEVGITLTLEEATA